MAFDQPQPATLVPDIEVQRRTKVRVRFQKGGDLRFVSHHDLMHCFERMFRRALLPVQATQGFNPRPRMAFALSLALGVVGTAEVLEIELDEPLDDDDVLRRLKEQAPAGLEILSVRSISPRMRAQVRRAFYRVPLDSLASHDLADLPRRIEQLLAASSCWVTRTRPNPRRMDLRPYLSEIRCNGTNLEMALWVTPNGAARPEEILHLLDLGGVLETGVPIERSNLEIIDEVPGSVDGPPPAPLPNQHSVNVPSETEGADPEPKIEVATSRPTSLIPGPMSFES